jgi:Ni/Co efflux regulator RcnB
MKARLWSTGTILFLLAASSGAMKAQDRGQDQDRQYQDRQNQDRQDQDRQNQDRHDQGRYDQGHQDQNNHGQNRDDQRQEHSRFDDHDRQVTRDWYNEHHDRRPRGLRDRDRLSPEYESRLREGDVLDRDMRRRIYPIPADYYRRLPPPPYGYRYVFIGGHVCLIDSGYRVHDVIHFELNY